MTNFLSFARPEPLTLAPIDLRAIVERAVDDLPLERGPQSTSPASSDGLMGDEVLLRQAFSNLMRNSIEACAASGVDAARFASKAPTEATARSHHRRGQRARHSGGVARSASSSRSSRPRRTAPASAWRIVQKVIVSHNGRIVAANRTAGGAQFRIQLPLATSAR